LLDGTNKLIDIEQLYTIDLYACLSSFLLQLGPFALTDQNGNKASLIDFYFLKWVGPVKLRVWSLLACLRM
jgi:hypothetical protein